MRFHALSRATVVLALIATAAACDDSTPLAPPDADARVQAADPAPAGLVTATVADGDFTFWPYISFTPENKPHDPVNLVFTGIADPRNIRDILMALSGTRAGPFAAFDCTWTDAIGSAQVTYAEPVGWTGSVIQLECGTYDPFRFHIRLFPAGSRTLGNAHVEILIPGTQSHQVLSWEVAEQLVLFDMARSGALGALPAFTQAITEAPTWDEIPPFLYNLLPVELRFLVGGPLDNVTEPVGMPNDGHATVLHLAVDAPAVGGTTQVITIEFGQFIPKPFCAEPGQMVRVDGAIEVWQTVTVNSAGALVAEMLGQGQLVVRNVTAAGLSDPFPAKVRDQSRVEMRDDGHYVKADGRQQLIPGDGPVQQLQTQLRVGSHMRPAFRSDERCGP
jgi:hypothetical protein